MDYEFWLEALEATIHYTANFTGRPVLETENGIGTGDDTQRIKVVRRALLGVERCIQGGIVVKRYFYWTVSDNFEWAMGYRPTFGLLAVDHVTQVRMLKPSANRLGSIARKNTLEET